ncbi:hypothetical protein [Pseudonocardia sp. TRM90224]|uniref:hypothetical protein n=1 Tax=Pseudonocardia sp. TRM90224 TaxID=2812678 RepID=UPI001E2D0882|nr:hypothetical protein [Pseudonocardia sp. TRM90224]
MRIRSLCAALLGAAALTVGVSGAAFASTGDPGDDHGDRGDRGTHETRIFTCDGRAGEVRELSDDEAARIREEGGPDGRVLIIERADAIEASEAGGDVRFVPRAEAVPAEPGWELAEPEGTVHVAPRQGVDGVPPVGAITCALPDGVIDTLPAIPAVPAR